VIVTLDVWRVPRRAVPRAMWRIVRDRSRLRRTPGVEFAKLLGTQRGHEFRPSAPDPTRWAALTVWTGQPAALPGWDRIAARHCRLTLRPVHSRGAWAGRAPFGAPHPAVHNGPLLVITRARLRPTRSLAFWRAIGPVTATLPAAPGLLAAFGIGEAPIGLQGTVSVWRRAADAARFAYRTAEHTSVVAQTPIRRWYAEELFARLAVLAVAGDPGVIGWDRVEGAG
jgi:hypothetical protein